jgi:hypothetical protein
LAVALMSLQNALDETSAQLGKRRVHTAANLLIHELLVGQIPANINQGLVSMKAPVANPRPSCLILTTL